MTARSGGIVLAGGRSSRMGQSKASLDWHGSTLLRRVVGLVGRATGGPVVVVRPAGRPLPRLPAGVEVVDDARDGLGPLQALASGLAALAGRVEVAYASATDVPLLHPALVQLVCDRLTSGHQAAVPEVSGPHPLAAAYRTDLAEVAAGLVAQGERSLLSLLDASRVCWLSDSALRVADADLRSLWNLNESGDYRRARAEPLPRVLVETGNLAVRGAPSRVVGAATLRQAAAAVGLELVRVAGVLNRDQVSDDPELPLVDGDHVMFMAKP